MIKSALQFIEEGISLNFSFSKKGEKVIVLVWPVIHGLEKSDIQPISIAGTPEEIEQQLAPNAFKSLMATKLSLINIKTFENSIKKLEEEKKAKATGKKTTAKANSKKDDTPSLKFDETPKQEEVKLVPKQEEVKDPKENLKKELDNVAPLEIEQPVMEVKEKVKEEVNVQQKVATEKQSMSLDDVQEETEQALIDADPPEDMDEAPEIPETNEVKSDSADLGSWLQ